MLIISFLYLMDLTICCVHLPLFLIIQWRRQHYLTWSATHDMLSWEINLWKGFDLWLGSNLWPMAPSAGCLTARPPELTAFDHIVINHFITSKMLCCHYYGSTWWMLNILLLGSLWSVHHCFDQTAWSICKTKCISNVKFQLFAQWLKHSLFKC